ncbi:MAG: glycosyltransferase family 2 protein [Imperialibacter sp.]|uniref:glycosyltransferase family 2 protein n=1 Tax=Imperialibacter sp. TaxID=2038411 RepID=UPI0032EC8AF8
MSRPKITIVTPSFNQAQFLEQTICSVLDQKYSNIEYLIIDGGSTDGSVEIIKKYERHLTYWESIKDRGQSHAINKGLQMATGDVFNWLNSDDYYSADALSTVAASFDDPSVRAVLGRSRIFEHPDRTIKISAGTDVYPGNLAKTVGWARIDQPETFFRLSAYRKVGALNESLHFLMDREWWIRYLVNFGPHDTVAIPDVLVNFRQHALSKTTRQQAGFEQELIRITSSLGMACGYPNIHQMFEIDQLGISYYFTDVQKEQLRAAVSYAILFLAEYFYYYRNDTRKAKLFLNNLAKSDLSAEDVKLHRKLQVRVNFLPPLLRKFYHKFS